MALPMYLVVTLYMNFCRKGGGVMNLLQNLTHTIYFALEGLKVTYPGLTLQYGFPATAPAGRPTRHRRRPACAHPWPGAPTRSRTTGP